MDDGHIKEDDILLTPSQSDNCEEKVLIYRTGKGKYKVIHRVSLESVYSGEFEYHDCIDICNNGREVFHFLMDTNPTLFGDVPWYLLEALDEAETRDGDFKY